MIIMNHSIFVIHMYMYVCIAVYKMHLFDNLYTKLVFCYATNELMGNPTIRDPDDSGLGINDNSGHW
jgi:hypothetical protein